MATPMTDHPLAPLQAAVRICSLGFGDTFMISHRSLGFLSDKCFGPRPTATPLQFGPPPRLPEPPGYASPTSLPLVRQSNMRSSRCHYYLRLVTFFATSCFRSFSREGGSPLTSAPSCRARVLRRGGRQTTKTACMRKYQPVKCTCGSFVE